MTLQPSSERQRFDLQHVFTRFSRLRLWGSARAVPVFMSLCLALGLSVVSPFAAAAPLDSMVKAVKFNDVSAVHKLLAQGIDPNSADEQGTPLLVIAAREKSNDVALMLMQDKRTDVNKMDAAGENAMMMAALMHDAPLVKALIDKGAEVNKKGWTPLHYAASVGDQDIVKMLLEASAYVDAGSPNGTTPMMMAARGGYIEAIDALADQGADPTLKNQIGLSALDFAKHYNEPDSIKDLTQKVAAWQTAHPNPNPAPAQAVITPLSDAPAPRK